MLERIRQLSMRKTGVPLIAVILLAAGLLTGTSLVGVASSTMKAATFGRPVPATFRLADELPTAAGPEAPPAIVKSAGSNSPEGQLLTVYRLIADQRMDEALAASQRLTGEFPNFHLAQLVYADLLTSRIAPLDGFGGPAAEASPNAATMAELRDEAQLRLRALQERPPVGSVPREFVLLPASVRFAIAVDTSRARLYLFENSSNGLKLVNDFYVSVGKQGVDKEVEGDQKTPLGVYFITDRLDKKSLLEDRFGVGALPLNYPNAYDKLKGRTGSGILVHGVPSNTYSRPPLDSDGCVAMANADIQALAKQLPQRDTPVLITRKLQWVDPTKNDAAQPDFLQALHQWQQARLQHDQPGLLARYESSALPASDPVSTAKVLQRIATSLNGFSDVSVLTWGDDKDVMVVSFKELSSAGARYDHLVHQYWGRDGADWKILAEGTVR